MQAQDGSPHVVFGVFESIMIMELPCLFNSFQQSAIFNFQPWFEISCMRIGQDVKGALVVDELAKLYVGGMRCLKLNTHFWASHEDS